MKILLVHNNYGKYSGEEAVVDKMSTMLKGLGHEVAQLRMSTEGLRDSAVGKIKSFVYSFAGGRACNARGAEVRKAGRGQCA